MVTVALETDTRLCVLSSRFEGDKELHPYLPTLGLAVKLGGIPENDGTDVETKALSPVSC